MTAWGLLLIPETIIIALYLVALNVVSNMSFTKLALDSWPVYSVSGSDAYRGWEGRYAGMATETRSQN